MRSLRRRAIAGGLVWAALSVAIGGVALFSFFDTITQRRFDERLLGQHVQVVAALGNGGANAASIEAFIADPAYARPYSGRYWQISGAGKELLVSRSLFDALLDVPNGVTSIPIFGTRAGPKGSIRVVHQRVSIDDGTSWIVTAAESLNELEIERQRIRQSLLATFALLGALGVAGAILQTTAVVRPLNKLRKEVAHRWDNQEVLDPSDYPEEVAPLVRDINTLLDRNREIVERGRRQAADLAHALKTPTAVLRNELEALANREIDVAQASGALDAVDAQLIRSLARVRAANSGGRAFSQINVANSLKRLTRLFLSMPDTNGKSLQFDAAETLTVPMDVQDFEEVLGNVLENALKWSRESVQVTAFRSETDVCLSIEDDGPGIREADRKEALRSGGRLDVASAGTGLGLAIAADLMEAYGGSIVLDESVSMGGLKAIIRVPFKHGLMKGA